ncbi:MFS general substrate transporter [Trematosphaeria pertusa]|uniref:MFS general substrate transporter n=1 Tax=Trematosphaeria pertusa TaxID=390896 RepID=A0A6A6IZQ3_9PLEO|nr:MFS general substrate transporter [Trematosphaeria pertusa]KAF2255718.1 MFS general substrate transporter [Trematosphaeria pertusa]
MPAKDEADIPSRESSEYENVDVEKAQSGPEMDVEEAVEKEPENTQDDIGSELEKHLSRKSSRKHRLTPEVYPVMDLENNLVGWESQDDPTHPRNFAERRKWFILGLVSAITFLSPLASSIFAPGIPFVNAAFHNSSQILGAFSVSVFVLGFAVGPLFLSPLSEIYGRRIVLNVSNVVFCAFNLGCALAPSLGGLIVMRLIAGTGGSACLTIGSGVISDLFPTEQRGKAMAMYSLGILFGPVLGPICGGFIAQRAGWRWDFWVVFIVACILTTGIIVLNRETNHVVLLDWKTNRLRKELERPELQNILTHNKDAAARSRKNILKQGFIRPLKLLFKSPIVLLLSLYMSFVFGLLFLLFTTITQVYIQTYGWSPELCGLAYLGVGLGNFMGIIFVARTSDATIIRLTKKNNNVYEPEMRLPTCVFFGFLIPISFFWYGWGTDQHVHWVVPIIGLLPFGFGMMGIFAPIQTYLVDAFPQYAASAIAGMTSIRCLFGAVLPLAGPSMYESLGLGWGNSLLGFVAVAMIPFPALIYKYGGKIRKRWPVQV